MCLDVYIWKQSLGQMIPANPSLTRTILLLPQPLTRRTYRAVQTSLDLGQRSSSIFSRSHLTSRHSPLWVSPFAGMCCDFDNTP